MRRHAPRAVRSYSAEHRQHIARPLCGMTNKMCLSSSVYSDGTGAVMNDTDDSSSAVASVKQTPALELKHRHSVDQRYPRTAGLTYVD